MERSRFRPPGRVLPALAGLLLLFSCRGESEPQRIVSAAIPAPRVGDWTRVLLVDFGPRDRRSIGSLAVSRTFLYYECAWSGGMTRNGETPAFMDLYHQDFVEGENAEFVLGVEPRPRYRIVLSLGDPMARRGPVDIEVNGTEVAASVQTESGYMREVEAEVNALAGEIRVGFRSGPCASFAIMGLAVYAPSGSVADSASVLRGIHTRTLPKPQVLPPRSEGNDEALRAKALELLRAYCTHLVRAQPAEGGFSYMGNWYENAYPIRMLLAASDLLEDPELALPAFRVLDRFVSEQLETGNWSSSYFGTAACPLAETVRRAELSSNLADIGVMTGALAVAAMRTPPPRRNRYLLAARRYADQIALPNQLDSGAFPNLRYRGEEHLGPYSVATATQAASLAVLHAATGDPRYRDAALRAGSFLAAQCRPGNTLFFPHDAAKTDTIDAGRMGDLFYVLEGLLFTERIAVPPYRQVIEEGLHRLLTSPRGLLPFLDDPSWWVSAELWEQSKRGGLFYLLNLAEGRRGGHRGEFEAATRRFLGCFADPACAADLGILEPPSSPLGKFSLVTTGFAGLGLISYLDPGMIPRMSLPLTADR